ncbi:MAG: Rha family transcriptional regulator [Rhodoferax sp.]|nr:Rha family transcriptional regulator [Rhodoferax sp.]
MTRLHTDLFPETLLVNLDQGHIFTTSRKVAVHFGKNHQHVLRSIKALLLEISLSNFGQPNTIRRLNFEPSTYTDSRGKTYPEYHLSHDGFSLLAMGFTGREALVWKLKFLDAFNAMESELYARTQRFAAALDQVRPSLRPVVDGTELGLKRAAIAAPLGKSCAAVTYHRRQARRLGLLAE